MKPNPPDMLNADLYFGHKKANNTLGNQLCHQAQELGFGDIQIHLDIKTQLLAVIAIHSLTRGPAIGGCRLKPYDSIEMAIQDAMRLARMMSYKSALIDLPHGGAKAVIIEPRGEYDRSALLKAYGGFVNNLDGRYITAVDSGTTPNDMDTVATVTPHVLGNTTSPGSDKGNASLFTATGVLKGIEAAVAFKQGRNSLKGMHIVIQGAGAVGSLIAQTLIAREATVTMADSNPDHLAHCVKTLGVNTVNPESVYDVPCDVFSPCALGGVLNAKTIPRLNTTIIAGSANNQLNSDADSQALHQRGILYAPDFLINAGGLIHVAGVYQHVDLSVINPSVDHIYERLLTVFKKAAAQQCSPHDIVMAMAEEKLKAPKASHSR